MKSGVVFGPNLKMMYSKLEIKIIRNKRCWRDMNLQKDLLSLSPAKFINKTMKKTTYSCQILN